MSVQALIADLLVPVLPPPRANKATGTRGERGEKGENPRPVLAGGRANMGESWAKKGESGHAPTDPHGPFALNSPLFAPDSPAFATPRTRAIAEDSPNSPNSPKVHVTLHSPGEPAPPLSPAALEVVYAWLRHVGETDLATGQEFIDGLARDPEQLAALYADVVRMGLADWPTVETDQATEPDSGTEATAKAVCSRCTHWTPDRINPAGGLGHCTITAPASRRIGSLWPGDGIIHCTQYQEVAR